VSAARTLDSALAMVHVSATTLREKALRHRCDEMRAALRKVAVMCADLADAIVSDEDDEAASRHWAGSKEALDAIEAVFLEYRRRMLLVESEANAERLIAAGWTPPEATE
jgi:hypothetical protein